VAGGSENQAIPRPLPHPDDMNAETPSVTHTPSTRPWRALVVISHLTEREAVLRIPGFSGEAPILIERGVLPPDIQSAFEGGQEYFHAQVNIGAEEASDLVFSDWEIG